MRAFEFIVEITDQQRIDFKRSALDYRELKLLIQYKQELLQKLEAQGISADLVGRGVAIDPPPNMPIQSKLEILRNQTQAIKQRLKSSAKSFASATQRYQQDRRRQRQMSGPVTTMTGAEYQAQQEKNP
jgi:hypothetical protein